MKCPNCSHEWTPSSSELAAEAGRKGGAATSRAKTRAARANAKLGGWPKGKKRGKRKRKWHDKDCPAYAGNDTTTALCECGFSDAVYASQRKRRTRDEKILGSLAGQAESLRSGFKDANQIAHGVVAKAEKLTGGFIVPGNAPHRKITQQGRPPQPLKVLPSPKSPKRGR